MADVLLQSSHAYRNVAPDALEFPVRIPVLFKILTLLGSDG